MAIFRHVVSRAWYPSRTECCVAVSRTAQVRRAFQLFIHSLWQLFQTKSQKQLYMQQQVLRVWQEQPAPETPMPDDPHIRVLETYDLSSSNIKHFIDSKTDLTAIPSSTQGIL